MSSSDHISSGQSSASSADPLAALLARVQTLQQKLDQTPLDKSSICALITQLQTQFQDVMQPGSESSDAAAQTQSSLPMLTEAHRWLKLLSIEGMKLRTARQPSSLEKVRSQIKSHLNSLLPFLTALENAEQSGLESSD